MPLRPRLHARAAALAAALLLSACATAAGPGARPAPPASPPAAPDTGAVVVLLSFDGLGRASYDRLALPHLDRLAARGVSARALVPSFPSLTFPNHLTLVTGRPPGEHGIVLNKMWDPALDAAYVSKDPVSSTEGRWYTADPLWVTAERQGVRTATFFWPGSMAAIGGTRPSTHLAPYDDALPSEARVDSVAAWLARPAASRPRFIALYVQTVDQAGHRHGPDGEETDSAVVAADRLVGRLVDAIAASPVAARTNLVVVSDHGMLQPVAEPVVDVSRWIDTTALRAIDNGPLLSLWFGADSSRRERVLAQLARGLAESGGHARAWRRTETPAAWRLRDNPRAGDLIVVAEPGWLMSTRPVPRGWTPSRGEHGWDPGATRALDGILVAAGPHIRAAGELPPLPNVHVAPFLGRLLGVRTEMGEMGELGRAIRE